MSSATLPSWTFGRSHTCDIVIEDVAVSNRHGRIRKDESGFVIEDFGSTNGIFVNGERIVAPTRVSPADDVSLGRTVAFPWSTITAQDESSYGGRTPFQSAPQGVDQDLEGSAFALPEEAPPIPAGLRQQKDLSRPSPMGSIHGQMMPLHGTVTNLAAMSARMLFIGRDPSCDLVLNVPTVSWRHASLTQAGGRVVITDIGSANGIFVGEPAERVSQEEIEPEDTVYLGSFPIPAAKLFALFDCDPSASVTEESIAASQGSPLATARGWTPPIVGEPMSNMQQTIESSSPDIVNVAPKLSVPIAHAAIVLGRDASCDQILDYPMVSRHHAKVTPSGSHLIVEDLASRNGTFVNGQRIQQPTKVGAGDIVSLGSFSITLDNAESEMSLVTRDMRGELTIEARYVSVAVPNKKLIENVSLTIAPGEFVGLMGPSGAGKTTLMNALNGYVAPSNGAVIVDGKNLHEHYDLFRGQIGYVPQDDIMHRNLTVREALYYTARLRFPPDFSESEIDRRIDEVVLQLGLTGTEDVLIGSPEKKGISGGQRKRVNLAMELLTDPSILFLDEPTSGLSSEDAVMVMKLLRSLADRGKTILLTIHQPSLEAFRLMDNLVLIAKDAGIEEPGRLAYFGPAYPDAVRFFNPNGVQGLPAGADPSPDEILKGLANEPSRKWAETYQRSAVCEEYVLRRQGRSKTPHSTKPVKRRREAGLFQALTLLRRNFKLKIVDRANTAMLLAQAPIIAIFIALVFGSEASQEVDAESWESVTRATATTLFLLALSSIWCGCSNAVREIVGEWAVYQRERMVNLKIPSYIAAKLAVLLGFSAIQTTVMLGITFFTNGLEGSWLMMFFILMIASTLGVAIGLLVSSLAPSSEFAVAMLPIVILPMVMLGGVLQPVSEMGVAGRAATYPTPSRWAFEAVLLVESDAKPMWDPAWNPTPPEGTPEGEVNPEAAGGSTDTPNSNIDIGESFFEKDKYRTSIAICLAVLGSMIGLSLGAVAFVLRRRDIH